jgi:polysaccharide pyruvyl transferase WcaK-like protein
MDRVVAGIMRLLVGLAKYVRFDTWQEGEKLKILLIGYNGRRNTGADLRVAAMVKQFQHLLGHDAIEIGVLTLDAASIRGYFPTSVKLEPFDPMDLLPLLKIGSAYHMGVLSEGSCLKSKFANVLTLLFIGFAGAMKRQGKPCLAYGSEAGRMDPLIDRTARCLCDETLFIARSRPSLQLINAMGLEGILGTDTAWTVVPAPASWAKEELVRRTNWDGEQPLLGVAVINPFWWPVKADLMKYLAGGKRKNPQTHYAGWYFLQDSDERRALFHRYLSSIAEAVNTWTTNHHAQVVLFGMEALDQDACVRLQKQLRTPAPIFSAVYYDGYQLTALLRALSLLITSRYHARVLSMPAGVPSIAISMDERLRNLLAECGHLDDYYVEAGDPQLSPRLMAALEKLWTHRTEIHTAMQAMLPRYLHRVADMGQAFRDFVGTAFPQFPLPPLGPDWRDYLPSEFCS